MSTLLFDLDDTLAATHQFIKTHLSPCSFSRREMQKLDNEGLSYAVGSSRLQSQIYEQILKPKKFITDADLVPWIDDNFVEFKKHLSDLKKQGVKLGICSHRGWNPKGETLSRTWLKHKNLGELNDVTGYIASRNHPCKLTWSNNNINGPFVIVDDNPVASVSVSDTEQRFMNNVVLCEAEQRFNKYQHFDRFNNFEDYLKLVNQKLEVLS